MTGTSSDKKQDGNLREVFTRQAGYIANLALLVGMAPREVIDRVLVVLALRCSPRRTGPKILSHRARGRKREGERERGREGESEREKPCTECPNG